MQYVLPAMQYTGRVFGLQLYYETTLRGKRIDQFIPGSYYQKYTTPTTNTIVFTFNVPRAVTVRHTQVWLLAMYCAMVPPGTTPTPSPSPASTASPSSSPVNGARAIARASLCVILSETEAPQSKDRRGSGSTPTAQR